MKTPKANSPWTRRIGAVFAVALLAARVSSVRAHPSPRDVEDERDPIPTNPREPLDLKKLFQDGIPPSPFADVFYRYADALLEHGRDHYGPKDTGLLLSALDRSTLTPLAKHPPAPSALSEEERAGADKGTLMGANVEHDENVYRLLYFLSGLTGKVHYTEAADQALASYFESLASKVEELPPSGTLPTWDTQRDEPKAMEAPEPRTPRRPWILWDRAFDVAPHATERIVRKLLTARSTRGESVAEHSGQTSARRAGFFLRAFTAAYVRTHDETFRSAIEELASDREEALRKEAAGDKRSAADAVSRLSFAIDADGASRRLPEPLALRFERLAQAEDRIFCSLPHALEGERGFALHSTTAPDGAPPVRPAPAGASYTSLWTPSLAPTTASVGVLCLSRYENGAGTPYRDLLLRAAGAYLDSLPGEGVDVWPLTFGQVITLELGAFRATADEAYFRRAFELGEMAVARFFGDSPLPRASLSSDHYESATGGDTLILALVELHLMTREITAVRAPVNTIDR